jgi:HD superfamily phosphohydrolase
MTYLVYPGATHRRFEHCLGIMELAGRIYDVVTDPENLVDESVRLLVYGRGTFEFSYWRRVVRMTALCHDLGHLPFLMLQRRNCSRQDLLMNSRVFN